MCKLFSITLALLVTYLLLGGVIQDQLRKALANHVRTELVKTVTSKL